MDLAKHYGQRGDTKRDVLLRIIKEKKLSAGDLAIILGISKSNVQQLVYAIRDTGRANVTTVDGKYVISEGNIVMRKFKGRPKKVRGHIPEKQEPQAVKNIANFNFTFNNDDIEHLSEDDKVEITNMIKKAHFYLGCTKALIAANKVANKVMNNNL